MTSNEALDKLLKSYRRYYDVDQETPLEPFAAVASFHSHEEGYFLVKSAKISEAESHEYIYFYNSEHITTEDVARLESLAWEDGMGRVKPHSSHRNSDVALVLIGDTIDAAAMAAVKKLHHYKSYKLTVHGWSDFRAVALDLSSDKLSYNRRGSSMKKVLKSIIKNK